MLTHGNLSSDELWVLNNPAQENSHCFPHNSLREIRKDLGWTFAVSPAPWARYSGNPHSLQAPQSNKASVLTPGVGGTLCDSGLSNFMEIHCPTEPWLLFRRGGIQPCGVSVGLKARLSSFPTSLGCFRDLGQMTLCLLSLQPQLPCQNPHIFYLVKMNIKGSHQGE